MKKVSLAVFAALVFAANSFAIETVENPTKKLSIQIHDMLDQNAFDIAEEVTANVRFTVNKEGEIVVLSIETESPDVEKFVKGRLNYQKVELGQVQEGKIYTVPVRFTS